MNFSKKIVILQNSNILIAILNKNQQKKFLSLIKNQGQESTQVGVIQEYCMLVFTIPQIHLKQNFVNGEI